MNMSQLGNVGGRASYTEGKMCDSTTLRLRNRTSALVSFLMNVDSVVPRVMLIESAFPLLLY